MKIWQIRMERIVFLRTLFSFGLLSLSAVGQSQTLALPRGDVVLSVSGKIRDNNQAGKALFDMAMLQALPQQSFTTQTPWDKEPLHFSGPLLRDVLSRVGASGTRIKAIALNDYQVEIPVEDAQRFDVIVALRMNGKPMPVRTRGPLFIIYPFDARAELRSFRYYERSIWQLRALHIE